MKHIYPSLSSCLYHIGFFEITSFPGVKFDNAYYSCPRFPSNFFIYSKLNILVSEVIFLIELLCNLIGLLLDGLGNWLFVDLLNSPYEFLERGGGVSQN